MDAVIERLRAEKEEYGLSYFDWGIEAGLEDAKDYDYDTLVEFANIKEGFCGGQSYKIQDTLCYDQTVENCISTEMWDDWFRDIVEEYKSSDDRGGNTFNQHMFIAGYIEGVCRFWEEVKDKV